MTKNNKHSPCNLNELFSYRTVVLILAKKVISNLPKFPRQKFGQAQQQSLICQRFQSISNMGNSPRRDNIYYILIKSEIRHNLRKYLGKSKVKTITITDQKKMVRKMKYAMYVQNSIFHSFLKNEKTIPSLF